MKQHKPSERGQALVMIAFAILGLLALTALSIDGGNVYSDRRNAQNAADTAVLATALSMIRNPDDASSDWVVSKQAGLNRAADNGYANDGTRSTVEVYLPPITGPYSDCSSPDFDCNEYVQVVIVSIVDTYFAPIVGITELTNEVNAVARVELNPIFPPVFGNAIISFNETECPGVEVGGSSSTTLIGGGLHVNSDCTDDPSKKAFKVNGGGGLTGPSLCSVGPYETTNLNVTTISPDCQQVDKETAYVEPNIQCSQNAEIDPGDDTVLHPGNFDVKDFPSPKVFPPKNVETLLPGTYCVYGDFTVTDDNRVLNGENVLIYMASGGIKITGGMINLTAPDSGKYKGLLFALPSTNDSVISITGNNTMNFAGTILAPSSLVEIDGGSATTGFMTSQVLADKVKITGSSGTIINYEPDQTWHPTIPPQIEFTE